MFQSFSKLLFLTGKKWWDNIGTRFRSEWEKFVIDIGEWLWHLSEYCPIFWSCLQFFLVGVVAGNWSVRMEYSLFSDISGSKSWELMDFCFENADTKGKNLDYILWLGMVMSVLMLLSRIYLIRLPSSSRDIFLHSNQSL